MGIPVSSGFSVNAGVPLELKTVCATLDARDALSSVVRYDGLFVYVIATQQVYQLRGGITNGDWKGVTVHVHAAIDVTADPFQTPAFANPLVCDALLHKDFKCGLITGNTVINLTNTSDGDAGMLEIVIDGTGGYTVTLGTMFTKNLTGITIGNVANADNFIGWRKIGSDIVYSILVKV